jgi:ABC-2 type transport system ATP-binding protein
MSATDGPVIEVHGLVKAFERFRAVDGLDLTVQRGEVHGFLGPNVPGSRRHCGSFWACIDGRRGRSGCSGSTPPRTPPR